MLPVVRSGLSVVPFDNQDTSVYVHRDGSGEHWVELRSSIACAGFVSSNPLLDGSSLAHKHLNPGGARWEDLSTRTIR
jgi:hypothetical protein